MGENGHPSDAPPFPLALGAVAPLRNKKAMGCTIGEKAPTADLARKLASEALGFLAKFGSSRRTPSELDGLLKSQLSWRFATAGFLATGPSGRRAEILGFPRSKEFADLHVCGLRIDYKEVDRLVEAAIGAG